MQHEAAIQDVRRAIRLRMKVSIWLDYPVETLRWGKIIHINSVRRVPTIHDDGRVTVTFRGTVREIESHENVLINGRTYYTFRFAD
jgi:hypothetical protein